MKKIDIIRYSQINQNAEIFSNKLKKSISRRTINDIKKQEANLLVNKRSNNQYKKLVIKYEDIDRQLYLWIEQVEAKGAILNDDLIKSKAMLISQETNNSDVKASSGWIASFKSRHGLRLRKLHGELFSTSNINNEHFLTELRDKIQSYGPENVYNADETGLFYKLISCKAVYKNIRKGFKLLKDRLSILLCANMTGTVKLTSVVIGKYKNPRCFITFKPDKLVQYAYSTRAWMTSSIFITWLLQWDKKLENENKKILLIIDNCPAHKITIQLKKIQILFLPPNMTAAYQPMDQGIIKCFKTSFNKRKLENIVDMIEAKNETFSSFKNITLADAILFIYGAWKDLKASSIFNCFRHASWVSNDVGEENEIDNADFSQIFSEFINRAHIEDPLDKNEFLDIEYNENEVIIEEYHLKEIKNGNVEQSLGNDIISEKSIEVEEQIENQISQKDCYIALELLKKYFYQKETDPDAIMGIDFIRKALKRERSKFSLYEWLIIKAD